MKDSMMKHIDSIMKDPATTIGYFGFVSGSEETTALSVTKDFSYDENVALTSAAFLDAIERNDMTDADVGTQQFIEDVMDDMKQRHHATEKEVLE